MPSFSIIIPTRNRADLAAAALTSAVWQQVSDCEIVLSDNSTDPAAVTACREAAQRFGDDPRVRYIRPSTPLSMPDHWEFATRHATKDYILILTDRFVMRPGSMTLLDKIIAQDPIGPPDLLTWNVDSGYADDGSFIEARCSGTARSRQTTEVLAEFASSAQWRSTLLGSNNLPRGLNSAVRRDIVEEIRGRYGCAYPPFSPDYTSAVHQLILASRLVEIDMPFYASHGGASTGALALRNGFTEYTSEFELDPFEGCPLQIETVMNATIRDYLWVGKTTGANLPPLNMVGYLLINYRELQLKRESGSPLDVTGMRDAILVAAAALSPAQRLAFEEGRAIIDSRETLAYRLRNQLAKAGALHPIKRVAATLRLHGGAEGRRYGNVLDAIKAAPLRLPTHLRS